MREESMKEESTREASMKEEGMKEESTCMRGASMRAGRKHEGRKYEGRMCERRMCSTEIVATCTFNKLLGAGLFLALDGTSMRTKPSTSGKKYRKSANNAFFLRNESLFGVSAAARSAFQLKHTPAVNCYAAYALRAIEYELSNMGKY